MASITHNLFWGQGETTHQLNVESGAWPTDMDGFVFIVGPDKRRPGGHWFGEQGLLCRIDLRATRSGRIDVRHRIIDTPVQRIRKRLPWLFKRVQFMELSPFGLSNLANTGVQPLGDRLLVGYDAGRPIEVDPKSMRYLTAVGATDEWYAIGPGALEPPTSVAAHPAVDDETGEAWFVNYSALPVGREVYLAKWDGIGAVHRWQLTGLGEFDSIHDIKATEHHLDHGWHRSHSSLLHRPAPLVAAADVCGEKEVGTGAVGGGDGHREQQGDEDDQTRPGFDGTVPRRGDDVLLGQATDDEGYSGERQQPEEERDPQDRDRGGAAAQGGGRRAAGDDRRPPDREEQQRLEDGVRPQVEQPGIRPLGQRRDGQGREHDSHLADRRRAPRRAPSSRRPRCRAPSGPGG